MFILSCPSALAMRRPVLSKECGSGRIIIPASSSGHKLDELGFADLFGPGVGWWRLVWAVGVAVLARAWLLGLTLEPCKTHKSNKIPVWKSIFL